MWHGCSIDSHKIWSSSHESFVKSQNTESWCSLNKMLRNYYVMRLPSIILGGNYLGNIQYLTVISPGTFQKLFFFCYSPYLYPCQGTYQSIVSSFLGVQSIRWSLNFSLANSSGGTDTDCVRKADDGGRSHSRKKIIFSICKTTISLFAGKIHEGNIRECCGQ